MATPLFPLLLYLLPSVMRSGDISNSSKLSCIPSLPASRKKIRSRTAEKKQQHLFLIISLCRFFRRSMAAYSAVGVCIWPNFEPLRALTHVMVTHKPEKDRVKKSREKMAKRFSYYKPMRSICCHGNQSSEPICT